VIPNPESRTPDSGHLVPIAIATVLAIVVVVAFMWLMQRRLMYFPSQHVPPPSDVGLTGVERVVVETQDGLALNGWFAAASRPSRRSTVLVFNGNAGNRAHRAPLAAALRSRGMHVLLFDYRGYGGNSGVTTESGLILDSRAVHAYIVSRQDVDASRLVYFGESLGAAVACGLATEHPPAALILRSPFTSMADIGQYHYPWLPVRALLRDRFGSLDRIAQVRSPLLVIAGGRDQIVPVEHSRRLYEAAASPKQFLLLPDADHNDDELLAGDTMIQAIERFIKPP
jgi:hypothetical protein